MNWIMLHMVECYSWPYSSALPGILSKVKLDRGIKSTFDILQGLKCNATYCVLVHILHINPVCSSQLTFQCFNLTGPQQHCCKCLAVLWTSWNNFDGEVHQDVRQVLRLSELFKSTPRGTHKKTSLGTLRKCG